jgi:tRNA(adenine34) deaminase
VSLRSIFQSLLGRSAPPPVAHSSSTPATGPATDLDDRMMRRALELAQRAAEMGEVPVGAVVYRGEEILAEDFNRRESAHDPTAHAELLAMRAAALKLGDWRLEGCTLAVTLEPCPMCAGAIVNARVPRVLYGARDPKAGAVASLFTLLSDPRLNHRAQVVGGVREGEASAQLRAFFKALRTRG